MTEEEKTLRTECSAAFAHMEELVDMLPQMRGEDSRLKRAENAAAVREYEKHYLALKNYVDHLYSLREESVAKCRKLHETVADPAELAEKIRLEGDRQAIITNDIAHNDGSAHNKLNEYGNFMLRFFSCEGDYRAALLPENELESLREELLSFRAEYEKTLEECRRLDALMPAEPDD